MLSHKYLLFPLIGIEFALRAGGGFWLITYQDPQGRLIKEEIRQEYVQIQFDVPYNEETYDPLSGQVHLTPGRII